MSIDRRLSVLLVLCTLSVVPRAAFAENAAWQALKQGGMVVLMRHATPERGPGKGDSLLRDPSCAKERKLSAQGRDEARQVGAAFRSRQIPIGDVWTSPYCRTEETARLAFRDAKPTGFLTLSEVLPPDEAARHTAEALRQIGGYRGTSNRVFVTHQPNIAAISFEQLEAGAFLVLKPGGGSDFDVVGKVTLDDLAP